MEYIKKALKSKTIKLALVQGVCGILIAVFTEFDIEGGVLVIKSLLDMYLRYMTTEPINSK